MNVLSLFDGMSCGRIALERADIPVTHYFASEIDKYAIQVSKANWKDIKHIGSVEDIGIDYNPFYDETTIWNILTGYTFTFAGKFDLIIGGSPCQGFSFAGLGLKGKKSKLFYEYLRVLNVLKFQNTDVKFLLENVFLISKDDKTIITELLGVKPVLYDSGLVSAQKRKRYYWSNIRFIGLPKDKGLLLKDVTLNGEAYILRWQNNITGPVVDTKCNTLKALSGRGGIRQQPIVFTDLKLSPEDINRAILKYRGKIWRSGNRMGNMRFPGNTDKKSKTVCATAIKGARETIHIKEGENTRILHPVEYERLQTLPDNYTKAVNTNARYRILGNGWTAAVVTDLLLPLNPAYDFMF